VAVREVLKMGHPLLQQVAAPVGEFNTTELDALLLDMFDTMAALDGAGLAAPQIGVNLRVVIFAVQGNPRYPEVEDVPSTVLINPQISVRNDEQEDGWEGCLSLPGLRGLVPRNRAIHYRGYDSRGERVERDANDFHARVVLHEVDHLDGILYPQRIRDLRYFGFESELFPESEETETPCA